MQHQTLSGNTVARSRNYSSRWQFPNFIHCWGEKTPRSSLMMMMIYDEELNMFFFKVGLDSLARRADGSASEPPAHRKGLQPLQSSGWGPVHLRQVPSQAWHRPPLSWNWPDTHTHTQMLSHLEKPPADNISPLAPVEGTSHPLTRAQMLIYIHLFLVLTCQSARVCVEDTTEEDFVCLHGWLSRRLKPEQSKGAATSQRPSRAHHRCSVCLRHTLRPAGCGRRSSCCSLLGWARHR